MLENEARLKWACRRGMLELDVLLGDFLEGGYPHLTSAEKVVFVELLSFPDPELFAWFMGHERPEDETLANMVERIRNHARSKF